MKQQLLTAQEERRAALEAQQQAEANLRVLQETLAPEGLKKAFVTFADKVLSSASYGVRLSNVLLASNVSQCHNLFHKMKAGMTEKGVAFFKKLDKPTAAEDAKRALFEFRKNGVESVQPAILKFLLEHPTLPSASEIDQFADDLDPSLLGDHRSEKETRTFEAPQQTPPAVQQPSQSTGTPARQVDA